jgi:hypothetical protein
LIQGSHPTNLFPATIPRQGFWRQRAPDQVGQDFLLGEMATPIVVWPMARNGVRRTDFCNCCVHSVLQNLLQGIRVQPYRAIVPSDQKQVRSLLDNYVKDIFVRSWDAKN